MAAGLYRRRGEVVEGLLQCSVCLEDFDLTERRPAMLPCHHNLCHPCLEQLGQTGSIRCPVCRTTIPFTPGLPAEDQVRPDHLRLSLMELLDEEACEKHSDERLKCFCHSCRKLACSSCVLKEHGDHSWVYVAEASQACKAEIKAALSPMAELVSRVEQGASAARKELAALERSQAAELQELDQAREYLEACLRYRHQTARAELQARVEQDRQRLETALARGESLVSSGRACMARARRALSQGRDGQLVACWVELDTAMTGLGLQAQETLAPAARHRVNLKNLPALTEALSSFGTVCSGTEEEVDEPALERDVAKTLKSLSERQQQDTAAICTEMRSFTERLQRLTVAVAGRKTQTPRPPEQTKQEMKSPVPAVHAGFTDEISKSECEWSCPALQYNLERCGPNCSVDEAGTTLVNGENEDELDRPGAYGFYGSSSSRPLPGTSYFEVRVTCQPRTTVPDKYQWCEVGVAEEAVVRDYIGGSIAYSSHAAVTATFVRFTTRVGALMQFKGKCVKKEVSEFDPHFNEVHMGILWDAKHRRVFFIHVGKATEMFRMDIETKEPLFCVSRTNPADFCGAEVRVELVTGDRVKMSDAKKSLILRLLQETRDRVV